MHLLHARGTLDLSQPQVMGILNVTPDSFSDGGQFFDPARALEHALQMVADGAAIIDVGGESTRPGASLVDEAEERRRVLPVVEQLAARSPVLISVDTSRPALMRAAVAAGAGLINDVRGLRAPGAVQAVAESGAAACLMHMQGEPATMQQAPHYEDVLTEVRGMLRERLETCERAGMARERLCVDPGIGFGKGIAHNLALLRRLRELEPLGCPIAVGVSRKSMLQSLTGRPLAQRLAGSLALATAAVLRGARIVRAHDVAPTVDALRVAAAMLDQPRGAA
ncbi:MAG TPA: dihydropteroate synthase [Steroidobacteraceae bacterium]